MDQSVRYTSIPCMAVPIKVKKHHNQHTDLEYNGHYHESIVTYTYIYCCIQALHSHQIIQFLVMIACRFWWTHLSGTHGFHLSGERSKYMGARGHAEIGITYNKPCLGPCTTIHIQGHKLTNKQNWVGDLEVILKSTHPTTTCIHLA